MPVRIYDISKKLGLENKEVLTKAKELGIAAARVASSSLDKITAEYLEQQLILEHPNRPVPAPPPPPVVAKPPSVPVASPTLPPPPVPTEPPAVAPAIGREILPKESAPPSAPVVVLPVPAPTPAPLPPKVEPPPSPETVPVAPP